MYFDRWRQPEPKPYYEKGWRRQGLADWDAKWHQLLDQTRLFYVTDIKTGKPGGPRTSMALESFPPAALQELREAGFIDIRQEGRGKQRASVVDGALDFTSRVRGLKRYHLLSENPPGELMRYLSNCFFLHPLLGVIHGVLREAGIQDFGGLEEAVRCYLMYWRWPGWVAASLKSPLAKKLIALVEEAQGPALLAEVPGRFPDHDPAEVRSVVDDLIIRLALFEDVDPATGDLQVGLLPAVRNGLKQARQPRQRPPLLVCEAPRELGPEAGPAVNDLRVFLLEVAGEPPRLRQDHTLFQKELERLQDGFEPLPAWLFQYLGWSWELRLAQTMRWARYFELVQDVAEDRQLRLHLSAKGQQWLAARLEAQYASLYRRLRTVRSSGDPYAMYYSGDDSHFLAARVAVVPAKKGATTHLWDLKPEQRQPLRDALFRAFADLPVGVFHRLDRFLAHATFEGHNPLLLGKEPGEVTIIWSGRPIPSLPERLEETGRLALEALIRERLIPLGAVRAGLDAEGRLCIARLPRLDEYFGQEASHPELVEEAGGEPRVIVQPDFSVIIIGLNPAPAAELAPFCERVKGHAGQGSLVLKITRESVVKAVIQGMDAAEIVGRLQRHASKEVPANVLHELRDWCAWVRRVAAETVTVIRCPDRETADRTTSALGKLAERLNETTVAVRQTHLTGTERSKLQKQGIIVRRETDAERR